MLAPDCESETAEDTVVRLGRKAATWWSAQGADVNYKGSMVVALGRDKSELDRFARRTGNHRFLGRDAIGDLEPQLAERFDRALYMHEEAHLNPRKTMLDLWERLKQSGVHFRATGKLPDWLLIVVACQRKTLFWIYVGSKEKC